MSKKDEQAKKDAALNVDDDDNEDDDEENDDTGDKNVKVENYKYAEDDETTEVSHPVKSVIVLPKHLEGLVEIAKDEIVCKAIVSSTGAQNPLRIFRAPHPRHGELVMFLGATYTSKNGDRLELTATATSDVARLRIYEIQSRRPTYSSWFIGDDVEPDSPLYIVSPLHSGFMALRVLVSDALSGMSREAFAQAVARVAGKGQDGVPVTSSGSSSSNNTNFKFRSSEDWIQIASNLIYMADKSQQQQQQQETAAAAATTVPFPNMWHGYLKESFDALCETKSVENGSDSGSSVFYRLSLDKARDWMQGRFQRVARSSAFDRLVFGGSKKATTTQQQQQNKENADAADDKTDEEKKLIAEQEEKQREQEQRAIEDRAFGLVAEYVPSAFPQGDLRRWLLGAGRVTVAAARPPAMTPNYTGNTSLDGQQDGESALKKNKPAAPTTMSASAKRLAKQGAPKGTPSVMSFFAPKKK